VINVSSFGSIGASFLKICPLGDCRDFFIDPDVSKKSDSIYIGEYTGSRTIYSNSEYEVKFVFINFNPSRKNLPDFQIDFYPNDASANNDVYVQILSTFSFIEKDANSVTLTTSQQEIVDRWKDGAISSGGLIGYYIEKSDWAWGGGTTTCGAFRVTGGKASLINDINPEADDDSPWIYLDIDVPTKKVLTKNQINLINNSTENNVVRLELYVLPDPGPHGADPCDEHEQWQIYNVTLTES